MGRSPGQPIREVKCLTEVKPWLIKEPTAPVDILRHVAKHAEVIVWHWCRTLIIGWFSNNFYKQIQLTCARLILALLLSTARPNSSLGFSPSGLGVPECYSSELNRLYCYFWNDGTKRGWKLRTIFMSISFIYVPSTSRGGTASPSTLPKDIVSRSSRKVLPSSNGLKGDIG
ncbi:hypothetical protein M404DRAFT_992391 [Pisolithus tinctorius Marx 270]|uniref:Uncharacterized protein n=1 Tax=Pisolithus tinctorius Marx 270 TaxID=870435 RepID=A0A0C3PJ24_PISTI|nr:hypothetical protein M404DRAFT_992391 [Pisolithus tinctorius Marx 270]